MTFDRSDFQESAAKAKRKAALATMPSLVVLTQAEVAAGSLTGDEKWDLFLRVIQGAIDRTKEQADKLLLSLADPMMIDDSEIRKVRQQLLLCNERIACWTTVITLPKQIIQESKTARELIDKIAAEDKADAA